MNKKSLLAVTLGVALAGSLLTPMAASAATPSHAPTKVVSVTSAKTSAKKVAAKKKVAKITNTNLSGGTRYYKKGTTVTFTAKAAGGARKVNLIKWNKKRGAYDIILSKTATKAGKVSAKVKITGAGDYVWNYMPKGSYDWSYGFKTHITTTKQSLSLKSVSVLRPRATPWGANNLKVQIAPKYSTGYVKNAKLTVKLQRRTGTKGKWATIRTVKNQGYGYKNYALPKKAKSYKSSATVYYRAVVSAPAVKTAYTGAKKVIWDNPRTGSAMEKKAHGYINKYCGDIPVVITTTKKGTWGRAVMPANVIYIDKKVPAKHLRTVALHECGHIKQFQVYGKSWASFKKQMDKLYGQKNGKGMEQNADCIANYWHKNSYYGYGGSCSGKKGAAGKAIALGKKYKG